MTLLAQAASDCERLSGGLVAQPVNTATSLAFVFGAVWLYVRLGTGGRPGAWRVGIYASAMVAAGLGSVVYHGGYLPDTARLLHDIGLVAVPVALVAVDVAHVRGMRASRAAVLFVGLLGAALLVLVGRPAAWSLVLGAVIASAAAAEFVRWRSAGSRPGRAWVLALAVAAAALPLQLLGRTGGPLCEPTSLLQPHAGWHLLSAVAVTAYGAATLTTPLSARRA